MSFLIKPRENHVGFSAGTVYLPKKGGMLRDKDHIRAHSRLLFVQKGSKKKLELTLLRGHGANVFWLSPGDIIHIPPYNKFWVKNHSKEKECVLANIKIDPIDGPGTFFAEDFDSVE